MLEFGGGFTASQMPNGTSIADHLGNKVALLNTAEGMTVHLHHHNEGGKLSILLDGAADVWISSIAHQSLLQHWAHTITPA